VGSKSFNGVRFSAYTDDHDPPHVHGYYAGIEVIVEFIGRQTRLSPRADAITPPSGKRSDVNHVLRTATKNADQLLKLWRIARG